MIAELQEAVSALPLDEFYDAVVERTGYALALETKGGDENVTRLENIAELKSSIVKSVEANPDLDLYSYLDEVALYTDLDNYDRAEDAAVMMTMHAAKGLEFPVVFIIGAEEGLFPSMQAIGQSEDMEEERRLCYVAITRAREKLYITCAAQRMLYGRTSANLPSRFTEEIPQTLLDRQGLAKRKQISGMTTAHSSPEEAEHGAEAPPAIPAEGCPTGPAALARAMLHAPDGPARPSARHRKSRRPSCPRRKRRTSKRATAWYIRRSVRA